VVVRAIRHMSFTFSTSLRFLCGFVCVCVCVCVLCHFTSWGFRHLMPDVT
jgi:hypothetical protein